MNMRKMVFYIVVFGGFYFCLANPVQAAWTPPIGIPKPAWPSDLDIARPTLPSPWTSDQAGYYYIAASGCSDARTYGNPSASRCGLPSSPAAGSVVVLNGTIAGDKSIGFSGTASNPVWIMGYSVSSKPVITGVWDVGGSYKIFDSLAFSNAAQDGNLGLGGSYNMVRACTFVDTYETSNGNCVGGGGSNNILYGITISQCGNWQHTTGSDIDRHGIKVGGNDLWIVDSSIYHCEGDGVQVGDQNNTPSAINRIYIGRNNFYENLQSCAWTKNATDVIFSQNTCHDISYAPGGDGQGLGGQYDPRYVWYLGNKIYNAKAGIKIAGSSNGGGGPWHAIGNLIYNIYADGSCNNYNMGALSYRNEGGFSAFFNTLYNVDTFISAPSGGTVNARNNIFSVKQGSCPATMVDTTFSHNYNLWPLSSYDPGNEANRQIESPASTFTNAGADFSLKSGSLAKDNANPSEESVFASFQARYGVDIRKDFTGAIRPQGSRWDIGAYEYAGVAVTKKGDLNSDSKVDIIDLGIFLSNWGATTKPPSDINQDGKVDIIDLGILLANW